MRPDVPYPNELVRSLSEEVMCSTGEIEKIVTVGIAGSRAADHEPGTRPFNRR
jgi:hypothetical protein